MTRKNLPTRSVISVALTLGILFLVPTRTVAWGSKGHQIIARIAMEKLSSGARQSVSELLSPRETLETVSTWADMMKVSRPDTRYWHHAEISLAFGHYDRATDCKAPSKTCIIEAIDKQIEILRNPKNPSKDRAEALKFLVHLVGDLHQPLNVTTNRNPEDRGGNLVKVVSIEGRRTNLNSIWNDDIINYTLKRSRSSVAQYATELNNRTKMSQSASISTRGSVTDWALESHRLAYGAYAPSKGSFMINDGKVWKLDESYYRQNQSVVEGQLLRAGTRLAKVLNDVFGAKSAY